MLPNKKISKREKLILLSFSIFFCFLFAEIIFRVFKVNLRPAAANSYFRFVNNPRLVYEFIPGAFVDGAVINKQGFRGDDFVEKKDKNTVRIVMLGDSITDGMGVTPEVTFSSQLEKILNQKAYLANIKTKYQVMNFGIRGCNAEAEIETLRTKALKYRPDIVILNSFHNDGEPVPGLHMFFVCEQCNTKEMKIWIYKKYVFGKNFNYLNPCDKFLSFSRVYNYFLYSMSGLFDISQRMSALVKDNYNTPLSPSHYNYYYTPLAELKALSKKNGFRVMICMHPHLLIGEHPNNNVFIQAAQSFNFPVFRMYEYYLSEHLNKELVQINKNDTCHPNKLGHFIVSKAMFAELKKNNLIDNRLK